MASMNEVAKRSGVSIATVSAVVNETKYVSDELKEKVVRAIKDLNYRPNRFAQSLKGKESKLIGVTVTEITNPFYPLMLKGVDDLALSAGFNVILSTSSDDEDMELKILMSMLDQGVDGVILSTIDNIESRALKILEKENISTVLINRAPKEYMGSKVCVNSYKVGVLATEHLLQLGHEKILFFGGGRQNTKEREVAFLKTMENNGLSVPKDWVVDSEYDYEKTKQVTKQIFQSGNLPTAIYAASDQIAFYVAKTLIEEGFSIPKDVSIVGSDNIPFSEDFRIPLTTVDVQPYEIGKKGFEILLEKLTKDDEGEPKQVTLEPNLVIRNSTSAFSKN